MPSIDFVPPSADQAAEHAANDRNHCDALEQLGQWEMAWQMHRVGASVIYGDRPRYWWLHGMKVYASAADYIMD